MTEVSNFWGPTTKHLQFVVVELDDLPAEDSGLLIDRICQAFDSHCDEVLTISSFLVIGYFGLLWSTNSAKARLGLVLDLVAQFGSSIRVAHGQCEGVTGIMGRRRISYNVVIPGFHEIREQLSQTPFGTAFEAPERTPIP
jgi:hypothetical protein